MNNTNDRLVTKEEAKRILKENGNKLIDSDLTSFVSLQHINKIYPNNVQAVYDFNLEIEKNEFVALVGPSGCGKSTTLRMIAGLEEITSGALYINKAYSNYLQSKDRDIAMVFQNYALYPQMTVYDNIAFGLTIRRIPKDEIKERVFAAADILDLEDYLDRKPRELSGGQMQRVALGRAIVRQAHLFLMDEPLSNLDAKLRVQMRSEIMRIHKEVGATTIYVTHDQTEAMTMADKIVVMNKGFIQQVGKAIDVYEHPNNLFVATFIGSPAMNILNAEYRDGVFTFDDGTKVNAPEDFDAKYRNFIAERIILFNNYIKDFDGLSSDVMEKLMASQAYKKEEKKTDEVKKKSFFDRFKRKKDKGVSNGDRELLFAQLQTLLEAYKNAQNGGKVKIGIRPEHVILDGESGANSMFNLQVTLTELLGSESIIHCNLAGNDFQVKTPDNVIMTGKTVGLSFNMKKLHVFDIESGLAITKI